MSLPVSLIEVARAMEGADDQCTVYLHRETGELVMITEEDEAHVASGEPDASLPEWQREQLSLVREVLSSEAYVRLPPQSEIGAYQVMERFCESIEAPALRTELLGTIRGRGAFRRFKDAIHIHDIATEWYTFHNEAVKALAADFLTAEGISYTAKERRSC
jgi:hypothetical protein